MDGIKEDWRRLVARWWLYQVAVSGVHVKITNGMDSSFRRMKKDSITAPAQETLLYLVFWGT